MNVISLHSSVFFSGSERLQKHSHSELGEIASRIIKVAGWELGYSQFGHQLFLSAQDPPHCDVLKL